MSTETAQAALDESRVRAEADRAFRALDRAARKQRKYSGGRLPKAPKSASQYHYHIRFSNKAKSGNGAKSAVNKIKYDFVMDANGSDKSRLGYTYISAPRDTPSSALDPVVMARACELAMPKKANLRTRMMGHIEVSLPKELNEGQRQKLIREIADLHRDQLMVPVYVAEHKPDKGNDNWHIHISHPMRYVIPMGDGGFALGNRIIQYEQQKTRVAAGLPKTTQVELRKMRAAIGNLIGDSLIAADIDVATSERWRHGHLKLREQVDRAIERGDVEFVTDNATRDPQAKEGYSASNWRAESHSEQREYAEQHNVNTGSGAVGAAVVTRTLFNRVLDLADRAGITEPEHVRMLARDMGLSIEWVRGQGKKRSTMVTGMRIQMKDRPKLSGKEVGITLYDLKRRFGWKDTPVYRRYPAKDGEDFESYKRAVLRAGLPIQPGQERDSTERAIEVVRSRAERRVKKAEDALHKLGGGEAVREQHPQPPGDLLHAGESDAMPEEGMKKARRGADDGSLVVPIAKAVKSPLWLSERLKGQSLEGARIKQSHGGISAAEPGVSQAEKMARLLRALDTVPEMNGVDSATKDSFVVGASPPVSRGGERPATPIYGQPSEETPMERGQGADDDNEQDGDYERRRPRPRG